MSPVVPGAAIACPTTVMYCMTWSSGSCSSSSNDCVTSSFFRTRTSSCTSVPEFWSDKVVPTGTDVGSPVNWYSTALTVICGPAIDGTELASNDASGEPDAPARPDDSADDPADGAVDEPADEPAEDPDGAVD